MKKKRVWSLLIFLVGFVVWGVYIAILYPISDIEHFVENRAVHDVVTSQYEKGEMIEIVHIEETDTYLVFYRTVEKSSLIRYATLKKGPIGNRYKYKGTYNESMPISHQPVKTKNGDYTILFGENPNRKLDYIEFTLYDEVYRVDVGGEKFFTWYQKEPEMEEKLTKKWDTVFNLKLFDRNKQELEYEDLM